MILLIINKKLDGSETGKMDGAGAHPSLLVPDCHMDHSIHLMHLRWSP